MNAASIIILALVVALVAFALYSVLRKDRGACSCGECSKRGTCPYCDGKVDKCD